ncbi:MAG TPA: carbohydrate-binding family 9-like protein [Thermoanaerobaculia bacterium]|nr:carbohydrate-binding family 9-like protein [Thermoanaerobaculia bacterium]
MIPETLIVPWVPFDSEEPWSTPAAVMPVRLRRATDAAAPRLSTSISLWYDDQALTVLFSCADDHVVATLNTHDAPLYEEDVVEAFLAPETLTRYFELEVSPRGTIFDARIDSPDGERRTMHADRGWTCDNLFAAVRAVTESKGDTTLDVVMRIPFISLGRGIPQEGESWRANFFRIDRHPHHGDEYSAWQPTMRQPADFHVPAAFGTLRFVR